MSERSDDEKTKRSETGGDEACVRHDAEHSAEIAEPFGSRSRAREPLFLGTLAAATRPTGFDTDLDGMPNTWESANGLNPDDAADRNGDTDADGYTNVEEYLNSLVP